ncbi:MAG: hypothetical protein J2P57_15275, partial [Acidimicrobiaceae bacterium]|nr:hypothetical protein [Acidimicrobiaceae bacterium]
MKHLRTTLVALGTWIVIAIVLAGCSGSSGGHRSAPSSTSGPTSATSGSTAPATSGGTAPAPTGAAAGLRWYIGVPVLVQLLNANRGLTTEVFDH